MLSVISIRFRPIGFFLLFAAAAIVGNYANVSLFWGVHALFGSVAVLAAMRFYGAKWGIGVAALSSVATAIFIGNPYLMLMLFGEALVVGFAYRRSSRNLVLLDGGFWLLLGMPLLAMLQYVMRDNGADMSLVLALRAGINGVFNALLAGLLVQAVLLWRWWRAPRNARERKSAVSLRQLLFNLLVAAVLMPALLVAVLDSRQQHSIMEADIRDELVSLSKTVTELLAKTPAATGGVAELMQRGGLHELQKIDLTLVDAAGVVVASSRQEIRPGGVYDPYRNGESRKIGERLHMWVPPAGRQATALRWKDMRYVMETPVSGTYSGKLIAEISSSFYQQEVLAALTRSFLMLSGITVLAFFFGWLLSRWLANPLVLLAEETNNLRFKLLDTHELELPDSPFEEMGNLVHNFRDTAETLYKSFKELYSFNELLETRVDVRTHELVETNLRLEREIAAGAEQTRQLIQTAAELETQKFALDQHSIVAITGANGIITYANDKFCEISQYSREELLGQDHRILNSGHHPKDFFKEMYATIGRGKVWKAEICNRRKDGNFYWVDTTIVPFMDADNKPYQYVAIRTDITERRLFDEALMRAKEAAEEASHAKSEFLSRMSHELRTPLNAIIGFTQILESGVDGELTHGQRESTANVLQASWHLLDLISEILDLARIESGRMAMTLEDIDLALLLGECADMIMPLANERHILIDDQVVQSEEVYRVRADRTRLKQVMLNLMSNAVKYNVAEGTMRLACTHIAGGWLRIGVTDSGSGIPADKIAELFKPFSRLDADKSEIQGTGVGLAVTKSLVEMMGGRVGVESELDKGTTFWVELVQADGQKAMFNA